MATATDPRERLVQLGNEILDATYVLEQSKDPVEAMLAAKDDREQLHELFVGGGMDVLLTRIKTNAARASLVAEYCAIRSTIEALEGTARPDLEGLDH